MASPSNGEAGSAGRRDPRFLLVAIVAAAIVLGVVVWALNRSDSSSTTTAAGEPTATVSPCEQEDSFFELKYQKHTGGFVIDDGLPADPEAAKAKIAVVSAQDPIVLRYFANDVFAAEFKDDYGPIPPEKDLTVLQNRKEEWQRLCLFLTGPDLLVVIVQLEVGQISNHVMDGNGNVGESDDSQVAPGEQGVAFYKDGNQDQAVVLRALCSNLITKPPNDRPIVIPTATPTNTPVPSSTPTATKPGEEVPTSTPTNTPRPGSSPTPSASRTPPQDSTATPVPPTATRIPPNTPRPPTQTPRPTFTPVEPCCTEPPLTPEPTFVFIPSTPVRNPTATNTPVIPTATQRAQPPTATPVSVWD